MVACRFSLWICSFVITLVTALPNFAADAVEEFHQIRVKISADPDRPGYHFLPPTGWMDDANGILQHNGQYHLFYQWIPSSAHRNGGPFHWEHAVSNDLVHWRDLPIAVSPTPRWRAPAPRTPRRNIYYDSGKLCTLLSCLAASAPARAGSPRSPQQPRSQVHTAESTGS